MKYLGAIIAFTIGIAAGAISVHWLHLKQKENAPYAQHQNPKLIPKVVVAYSGRVFKMGERFDVMTVPCYVEAPAAHAGAESNWVSGLAAEPLITENDFYQRFRIQLPTLEQAIQMENPLKIDFKYKFSGNTESTRTTLTLYRTGNDSNSVFIVPDKFEHKLQRTQ